MLTFLAKKFIKDHENYADARVRGAYGKLCGALGIVWNVLLFAGKLLAGALSGSIAVTADAFNNLSDAGSSLITLLGFQLASKKPDREHPFGHGRVEYLAGLAVAAMILLMGVELLQTSARKIVSPEPSAFNLLSAGILAASVLVKLYMAAYNRKVAGLIHSEAMKAAASDSLSDAVSTTAVLLAMILGRYVSFNLDAWSGLAVSLLIIRAGFLAARDTVNPLLGKPPEPELIEQIESTVLAHEKVLGIHDLIVHDYGPGRRYVSLHAEVSSREDVMALHDLIDLIERELAEKCACEPVIHMDPIVTDDAQINEMRTLMEQKIEETWGGRVRMHDFRMVKGPTHTNLIFDAVVPLDMQQSDSQIRRQIEELAAQLPGTCFAVVKIDKPYV